jgi:hypothetical protein
LGYNQAMRALGFGLVLLGTALGLAVGCGSSTSDGPGKGGAGTGSGGRIEGGALPGNASGSSGSGSSSGGSASAGSSSAGQSAGGTATGGQPDAQAGSGNEGGAAAGLVDCDPLKISCKRAAPACGVGEVPSLNDTGNCYGECVKIERCACSSAAQCPEQNQYTCWAKQHCGPFVQ